MRCALSTLLVLTSGIFLFGQTNDPKAGAKRMLALRAAAEKARMYLQGTADANESAVDELSQLLSKEMLGRVKEFEAKKTGEKPTRKWIEAWRMQELEKTVSDTLEWAKEQSPLPIERADVLKRAAKDWAQEAPAKAQQYAKQSMEQVYGKARELAAGEQLKRLRDNLSYPTKEDLNGRLNQLFEERSKGLQPLSTDDFNALNDWFEQLVGKTGPVFEELKRKVSEMSTDMCLEISKQYQAQYEQIRLFVQKNQFPESLKTKEELQVVALQALNKNQGEDLQATPPVYGVFEASEKLVERAAMHWEKNRFENFLKSTDFWLPQKKKIEQAIRDDIANHVPPGKSLNLLTDKYLSAVQEMVAVKYGGEKWSQYFADSLKEGGALTKSLSQRLRDGIKKRSQEVRKQIAEEQLRTSFKNLFEGTFPKESQILWFYEKGKARVSNFPELLENIEVPSGLRSNLLEETKRMAVDLANKPLVPALNAFRKQFEILRVLEKEKLAQLKVEVVEGRAFPEILKDWQAGWNELWDKKKKEVEERWYPQFEHTGKELSKAVRQLYEGMINAVGNNTPEIVQAPTEELGGDKDTSGSEAVPVENEKPETKEEEKKEEKAEGGKQELSGGITDELKVFVGLADGVFAFADAPNGKCRMLFGTPDGVGAFSLEFDPQDVEGAASLISQGLQKPLGLVLDGNAKGGQGSIFNLFSTNEDNSEIRMLFRVSSSKVRHQMSILVRQQVEAAIENWANETGEKQPVLLWQDEVEL